MDLKQLVDAQRDLIINTRRDLHRIPETAFTEKKTSAYVTQYLQREALAVKTGIARTGVVGLMQTADPGPTLLIRSDMDALPVEENTGLAFSSTHPGAMHACGHDGHMAMVLGAVTVLNQLKSRLKGSIKFVFQPAEEGPGGAKPMIEEGVLENPPVDYAVGCHVWPEGPEGTVGVKAGPLMAAMDRFDIKIIGKGGHGAMPHLCVDALEVATQVVNALQRMVSRHMNPLRPAVVTVGSLHAGTTFNVIAGEAELSGTTRTFDRQIWNSWKQRMEKIVAGVCDAMGASYELQYTPGYPPLVNDAFMTDLVRKCAAAVVGQDKVIDPEPTMGGEDMAFFLEKCKGCYFFLGVGREGSAPIHNPRFDFNEDILLLGVQTYCRIAMELLGE
jgi:amidohydrolase